MREYLFRGKRRDNGEWLEGNLIHCDLMDGRSYTCILESDDSDSSPWEFPYLCCETGCIDGYARPVDPETVGQFTGLTDKNGKKIFEGDIVKHYNRDDNPAAFDVGRIFWDTAKCRWLRTAQKCDYNPEVWSSSAKNYVVIGNIHDNPELLEGA